MSLTASNRLGYQIHFEHGFWQTPPVPLLYGYRYDIFESCLVTLDARIFVVEGAVSTTYVMLA